MSTFAVGDTVKTAFYLVKNDWRALLRAAKWPAVAFIPAIAVYIGVLFATINPVDPETQLDDFGLILSMMGPAFLAMIPILCVILAFNLNWQTHVMGTPDEGREAGSGDDAPLGDAVVSEGNDWWAQFRLYILRQLQLLGAVLVLYMLFFGLFFYAASYAPERAGLLFFVFFVCMILIMPIVLRASLVFPAIAAGLPEPTFRNALDISRGIGWRMVGAHFLTALIILVLMLGLTLALGLVDLVVSSLAGQGVAFILSFAALVIELLIMLATASVYASIPALVLMQLLPAYADRWKELSGAKVEDDNPPLDPPSNDDP